MQLLPSTYWQQEGGERVDFVIGFLVSVGAGVIADCISKWLERHDKDDRGQ